MYIHTYIVNREVAVSSVQYSIYSVKTLCNVMTQLTLTNKGIDSLEAI